MNVLSSVITYVRRIIKSPSNAEITDNLILDYINRFWIMDVDARIQLFDLKTKYQFITAPGVDQYNMPLYSLQQSATQNAVTSYPVYQGFEGPCFVNGIEIPFYTQRTFFNNIWPNYPQSPLQVGTGNGSNGPYTFQLPFLPTTPNPPTPPFQPVSSCILRGHIDIEGLIAAINSGQPNVDPPIVSSFLFNSITNQCIVPVANTFPAVYFTTQDSTGANLTICDSGQFLTGFVNNGLLMAPGPAPYGNAPLPNGYSSTHNTINYFNGVAANVFFSSIVPMGQPIYSTSIFYQLGIPRAVLYYDNSLTFRAPPNTQYFVELNAFLSPAAFLNTTDALPYAYMAEYIARGAARKILSDTGDVEQFNFYEPFFIEQERLVWKRSQRQWTSTRTQTLYSQGDYQGQGSFTNFGSDIT